MQLEEEAERKRQEEKMKADRSLFEAPSASRPPPPKSERLVAADLTSSRLCAAKAGAWRAFGRVGARCAHVSHALG
jgi:hypothetical protein